MTTTGKLLLTAAGALCGLFLIVHFGDRPDGAELFKREGCATCHSFRGSGGATGPELTAVTKRRDDSWIRSQIRAPQGHNPATTMPAFSHLSHKEISALIRYLKQDAGDAP